MKQKLIESQDWSYSQKTLGGKQKNLDQKSSNNFSFRKDKFKSYSKTYP